jgi:prevent-host-death family protein
MTKRVSAAQAKAHLSDLMAKVAYGGEQYIIERRGKPLAALVSVDDLERLEQGRATSARPRGALAIVGAWREVDDRDLDALLADIYSARAKDTGRPVTLEA